MAAPEPLIFHPSEGQPILILTRKVGEQTRIGSNVVLIVEEVEGYRVRLRIEAPPEVSIRRAEVPACGHDAVADLDLLDSRLPDQGRSVPEVPTLIEFLAED